MEIMTTYRYYDWLPGDWQAVYDKINKLSRENS